MTHASGEWRGRCDTDGGSWSNTGHTLKVEPIGLANEFSTECERKNGVRMTPGLGHKHWEEGVSSA